MVKLFKEQIQLLLKDFASDVEDGLYSVRIPYKEWKYLKQSEELWITITDDIKHWEWGTIKICRPDRSGEVYSHEVHDNGFGDFLFDTYFKYGGDSIPMTKTTISNGTITYAQTDSAHNGYYITYGTSLGGKLNIDFDYASSSDVKNIKERVDTLESVLATKEDKKTTYPNKEDKENKKMLNFDFGPCNSNNIKMSVYGLAVKNTVGAYVSYDAKNDTIIDVDILNFEGAKYLYKMPVAIKDVKAGDIVIHAGKPMFVTKIGDNAKSLHVVDPISGEKKEVMLTRSPFGFDFATKIVNFLGDFMAPCANADNPFGNMWMLMLADGKNNSFADIAPLMLMSQNSGDINPMMMYFALSGNGKSDNLLPFLFMMNSGKHTCNCGGKCTEVKVD